MAQQDPPSRPTTANRIPKLSYRNPLPPGEAPRSSHSNSGSDSLLHGSSPGSPPLSPNSALTFSSAAERSSSDTRGLPSSHTSSDVHACKTSKPPKKKKANAVLAFFTLKEPSQSAFEQYAKQQLKQAEKGKQPSAVAGIPNHKLPENVPKVNSKWDGVPEAVKAKEREKKRKQNTSSQRSSHEPSVTDSSVSSPTKGSSSKTSRHASKTSSKTGSSAKSTSAYDSMGSGGSRSTRREQNSGASFDPMSTLPEMTYFFPDDPDASSTPQCPSGIPVRKSSANGVQIAKSARSRSVISLPTVSEVATTGRTNTTAKEVLDTEEAASGPNDNTTRSQTVDESQTDKVMGAVPSPRHEGGFHINRPSSDQSSKHVPNFDTPQLFPLSPRPVPSHLSNPPPPSAQSREQTKDHIATQPAVTQPSGNDRTTSITSTTPSEMSASWYQTSRQRLGLGSHIRKDTTLPWEDDQSLQPGKRKKKGLGIFGKSAS